MSSIPVADGSTPAAPVKKRKMRPGGGIYLIKCNNGCIYVGSAKNLSTRFKKHVDALNASRHFNIHLQRAWAKYGASAFSYVVKEELGTYNKGAYFARENAVIDELKAQGIKLFNIARAEGGWGPDTHSRKDEIVAKIRRTIQASLDTMTVDERKQKWGHWRGKKQTDTHRAATSAGLTGIVRSATTRLKMGASQKKRSDELAEMMRKVGRSNAGRVPPNAVAITIDGTTYTSGKKAQEALGVTDRQLQRMIADGTAVKHRRA